MEYKIITSRDCLNNGHDLLDRFIDAVNKYVREGWVPVGGVQVIMDKNPNNDRIDEMYQAVIREMPGQRGKSRYDMAKE